MQGTADLDFYTQLVHLLGLLLHNSTRCSTEFVTTVRFRKQESQMCRQGLTHNQSTIGQHGMAGLTLPFTVNILFVLCCEVHYVTCCFMGLGGDLCIMECCCTNGGGSYVISRNVVAKHHLNTSCQYGSIKQNHNNERQKEMSWSLLLDTYSSSLLMRPRQESVATDPPIVILSRFGRPNNKPFTSMG